MLRERIEHPVTSIPEILRRQSAVGALAENLMLREELSEKLSSVLDLERLITRVIYKTASARELRAICQTVSVIPDIKRLLCSSDHDELISLGANADELSDVRELIDDTIVDTPPFQVREGGMIKPGYSPELDELRSIVDEDGYKRQELPLSHYAHRYEKYGVYDYRSEKYRYHLSAPFVFTVRADIISVCLGAFPL